MSAELVGEDDAEQLADAHRRRQQRRGRRRFVVIDVLVDMDVPAAGSDGDPVRSRNRRLVAEGGGRRLVALDGDVGLRVDEPDLVLRKADEVRRTGEDDARVEPRGQVRRQQEASATGALGRSLAGGERDRDRLELRPDRGPVELAEKRNRRIDDPIEEPWQAHRKVILVSSPSEAHSPRPTRRYQAHSCSRARPPSPKSGTTPDRPPIRVISG